MNERSWLITGISSGLGRAMAEELLTRGERIAGTYRKAGTLSGLKSRFGDRLWLMELDVTDTASMRDVVDAAFRDLGRIDVVVSNAGYGILGAAEELSDAEIDRQIATNLTGSIQFVRAVTPHLREQGGGRIIQISTMGGLATFPGGSLYHASKWGIEGFMESVRHELAPFNIAVTIAEPGSTATNFGHNLVVADPLDAYADGPLGQMRAFFGSGTYRSPGDALKTVKAIIATADQTSPPLRLATGSDAYNAVHAALTARLAELDAQKSVSFSTDADSPI
ncbi:SDR family oxidoreductase [Martelella soudanensis]|uniref:SDR family oxidoreductase n=1 Tax=unclassified Martelella TaxID=2629616 RepID=UPI0015DFF823|nr:MULTISPECIES: SDR family oxidoreductase [unclassified Martelella]